MVTSRRNANPEFQIQWDSDEGGDFVDVPTSLFQLPGDLADAGPSTATITGKDKQFAVNFKRGTSARMVRLVLEDWQGSAPSIERIELTSREGEQILPTKTDLGKLRENDTLEIVPGDRITVAYEDQNTLSDSQDLHEALLTATFFDASINPAFVEYQTSSSGKRSQRFVPMRRFLGEEPINILIRDPDQDTSGEADTVTYSVRTSTGKSVELEAIETEPHSGIFRGSIFPVQKEPTKPSEIQVTPGDDLLVSYLDQENTSPGIPWYRTQRLEQASWSDPELRIFETQSVPLTEAQQKKLEAEREENPAPGTIPPTRNIRLTRPDAERPTGPSNLLIGAPLVVELTFPTIALSPESEATVYVQTRKGREKGGESTSEFDTSVPGTLKLTSRPSSFRSGTPSEGYADLLVEGTRRSDPPLDAGHFTWNVPLELAEVPETSLVDVEKGSREEAPKLAIGNDDTIYLGFQYTDSDGNGQWITGEVTLGSDAFLNVMDRDYEVDVQGAHVGETLYFRVADTATTDPAVRDRVAIQLKTNSGSRDLELVETLSNSGVYQGLSRILHRSEVAGEVDPETLVVDYGDRISVTYNPDSGNPLTREIEIFKGADGSVIPFTKNYQDADMAVQTQFTAAEAYFEMAKKYRKLGEKDLAERSIAQGKRLLEEALTDFPNTSARAQGDYLLANLAVELGDSLENEAEKERYYTEAVTRFNELLANFPDSPYAPKSQFKKALVFEKMGDIDQASEEYVKLSYIYPDNELVAETIARLGQYFLAKGSEMLKKSEETNNKAEAEKLRQDAINTFTVAAEVFGRLAERFPSHHLAGKTRVLSGQCYIRADKNQEAIKVLTSVLDDANAGPEVRAEAMYWCADSYVKLAEMVEAYRLFKRLTWDYPESKWAKFARGRLTEPDIATAGAE